MKILPYDRENLLQCSFLFQRCDRFSTHRHNVVYITSYAVQAKLIRLQEYFMAWLFSTQRNKTALLTLRQKKPRKMKWLFFLCMHEIQEIDTDTNMNSSTNLMQGNLCTYTCLNKVVVCKLWTNEEKSKLLTERNGIEWNEMNKYSLKQ